IGAHGVVAGPDSTLQSQPAAAIRAACAKDELDPGRLDLIEINEAFAAVGITAMRELGADADRVNVNGGAIALGHPIGMSGARLVLHLALELRRRGGGVGAAGGRGGPVRWGRAGGRTRAARPVTVDELVARAVDADRRAIARLVSMVEDASPLLREVMAALIPHAGSALVIGLTGAPGVGKSTSTSALVTAFRAQGLRVGVLAVDPTSPFTGGALLGDRVRMQDHATDDDVFIRSMATRGHLGGLAWATPQAVRILDAAGCDVVLVETVGVGQSEVDVAGLADTTVVLLAPGMGDGIQAAKAGILEVGDIFVVNKADRDGADAVVRDLRATVRMTERAPGDWRQPILTTVASRGEGIDELVAAIEAHRAWAVDSGTAQQRRVRRVRDEIQAIAIADLRRAIADLHGDERLDELARSVLAGEQDPYVAADTITAAMR